MILAPTKSAFNVPLAVQHSRGHAADGAVHTSACYDLARVADAARVTRVAGTEGGPGVRSALLKRQEQELDAERDAAGC